MERAEARFRCKIIKRQDLRDVAFYLLDHSGENGRAKLTFQVGYLPRTQPLSRQHVFEAPEGAARRAHDVSHRNTASTPAMVSFRPPRRARTEPVKRVSACHRYDWPTSFSTACGAILHMIANSRRSTGMSRVHNVSILVDGLGTGKGQCAIAVVQHRWTTHLTPVRESAEV